MLFSVSTDLGNIRLAILAGDNPDERVIEIEDLQLLHAWPPSALSLELLFWGCRSGFFENLFRHAGQKLP